MDLRQMPPLSTSVIDARLPGSQYVHVISNTNPLNNKQLERKLQELDNQQKIRGMEMFWKQRQFFIEKAFNENGDLRFVKLKVETSMQKQSQPVTLPELRLHTSSSNNDNSSQFSKFSKLSSSKQGEKQNFTRSIFPKIVEDENEHVSYNSTQVLRKEKTLLQLINKSEVVTPPKKSKLSKLGEEYKNNRQPNDNPVLMPLDLSNGHKNVIHETKGQVEENMAKGTNRKYGKKTKSKKKSHYKGGEQLIIKSGSTSKTTDITEEDGSFKAPMSSREHFKLADLEHTSPITSFANENISDELDHSKNISNNDIKRPSFGLFPKSTEMLTSDELLLKLTMSLPMRLLLKTDQSLSDLSSALGYNDRRCKMIKREKTIVEQSALEDERFKKLMNCLEKQDDTNTL